VSALTRATKFGRVKGYAQGAGAEIALLVQVETLAGLDAIEAIAAVDGVDGIFIGPADLSRVWATMATLATPSWSSQSRTPSVGSLPPENRRAY
jgi:4-hydroxy-2-oxoheptanedioate aldolase